MSHNVLLPYGKYLWLINTSSYPGNKANQDIHYIKAYCVGGSKCHALPLYAVKLTKARAILISPGMWLGQYEYCPATLAP